MAALKINGDEVGICDKLNAYKIPSRVVGSIYVTILKCGNEGIQRSNRVFTAGIRVLGLLAV